MDAALKTVAYLRVSTRSQDLANQKLAILEFSQKRRFPIDQFIESRISSRQSPLERRIDEMLGTLEPGDRLLVSELSRLGRSLSQVIQIVETLVRRKIRFIAIKEAIEFDGKQDLRTKVMIALFGLFAEVERDLISERTKEALAAAKAKGKLLGRPTASVALKRLVGHGPKNRFYRATRELGRVFKTEFILDYLSQPALRTRIRRGLLKGEQLHVGETWRSGLSSTKPNFLRSTSSRPAHFSKQPG